MRLILGLAALIVLFALLVRTMPPTWALPLYLLFVVLTIAFTGWERRRISRRRRQLEQQLRREQMDFAEQQQERKDQIEDRLG